MHSKVIIIGSGPAGYSAAIYSARAMLEPIIIAGIQPGGQLTITTEVENYPGFADTIQGPWLMEQMQAQAVNVGARLVSDIITSVDLDKRPIELSSDSGTVYTCDALILATGAQAKWLGLPSEEKYQGFGVSACATCDGFFYKDKHVLVVGGGNTAVEEALYLSKIAGKVTVVHRRDSFRAEQILQKRLFATSNVDIIWDTQVEEITGKEGFPPSANGVKLKNTKTGDITDLPIDGIFIAIGHAPSAELVKDKIKMKDNGYVWTQPDSTKTSIAGVFAAGDVTDDIYRQAVTAAGMGCMAALEAEKYIAELEVTQDAAE